MLALSGLTDRSGALRHQRLNHRCIALTPSEGSSLALPCRLSPCRRGRAWICSHLEGQSCSVKSGTTIYRICQYSKVRRPACGQLSTCFAWWTKAIWRVFSPMSNETGSRVQTRWFGYMNSCASTAIIHTAFSCLRACWRRPCASSHTLNGGLTIRGSAWFCVANVPNEMYSKKFSLKSVNPGSSHELKAVWLRAKLQLLKHFPFMICSSRNLYRCCSRTIGRVTVRF